MPRPTKRKRYHTTSGSRGGNLELERQIRGLGPTRSERRIRKSVGSSDPDVLKRAHVLLDKLIKDERWELLRDIRDDKVTLPDLLASGIPAKDANAQDALKQQAFLWDRRVVLADQTEKIVPGAISSAFGTLRAGPNRDRYINSFGALQRKAAEELPADATVEDLLAVDYEALYERWGAGKSDWMRLRQAISKFATLHFKDKFHPVARQLRQSVPYKTIKPRKPKIAIETFLEILKHVPPHAAASYWVLVITGVRRGEYLASGKQHLNKATHTYDVPGTKNERSENTLEIDPRWWIFLERGIPSRLKEQQLRRYFKRACLQIGIAKLKPTGRFKLAPEKLGPGYPVSSTPRRPIRKEIMQYVGPRLHDLRHCHGQWAINAGVAESKVQASFRHATPGMTRDYVMQASTGEVSKSLADLVLPHLSPPAKKRKR